MDDNIWTLTVIVFFSQVAFVASRTWNIATISRGHLVGAVLSGIVVHTLWLLTTAIGVISTVEIITEFRLRYLPVVLASVGGGVLGTWLIMRE